jgi:hypothetical protein
MSNKKPDLNEEKKDLRQEYTRKIYIDFARTAEEAGAGWEMCWEDTALLLITGAKHSNSGVLIARTKFDNGIYFEVEETGKEGKTRYKADEILNHIKKSLKRWNKEPSIPPLTLQKPPEPSEPG